MGGILAFGFMGIFLGPIFLVVGGVLLRQWMTAKRAAQNQLPTGPKPEPPG
jgi:predicted PurR-regulated permease PerM